MTYEELPIGIITRSTGNDDDVIVVRGTATSVPTSPGSGAWWSYSYGVYDLSTSGGNDVVYLENLTAIDPDGVNPRARQSVSLGAGNDFSRITSLTAATVYGGEGNDSIIKIDLLSRTYDSPYNPDEARQDPFWTDFNIVDGGNGDDTISMGDGADWIYGGNGHDYISVEAGNNVVFGGDGNDTILALGFARAVATGGSLSNPNPIYYALSANSIWGGSGNDTITIADVRALDAGSLVATINGEDGDDVITVSSAGNVWITGGNGNDTIATTALAVSYNAYGSSFNNSNDVVYGDVGNDTIQTGRGDDTIVGGEGHDWIFGGTGDDQLYGGVGGGVNDGQTDRFSFEHFKWNTNYSSTTNSVDRIYDYEPGSRFGGSAGRGDVIDLAGLFAADPNDALVYDAGNPFLQGELRLSASGADTLVQANDGQGGWYTFLILFGVASTELDITSIADVSAGLANATGGDFLWYTG